MEKEQQPEWVEGGEMFDYQLEGMKYHPLVPYAVQFLIVVGFTFNGINRRVRF